jgi:hypothetical protein
MMMAFFKRKRKCVSVFRFMAFKKFFDAVKLKEFRRGFKAYIHELALLLHELKFSS